MQAVIMAGGFGTRLRPLTNNLPKPMVPIVNKPILGHIIIQLRNHNRKEYSVLLYYKPDIIKDYFKDGSEFGVDIKYIIPDHDYNTAGAVKLSEEYIKDNFLVISGDVLTNFNLTDFYNFHVDKNSLATISLYSSENPVQYGIVLTDNKNRIVNFLEKPASSEVFSDTINTGIYYFKKEVFEHIPEGEIFDFSKDLFSFLLSNGIPMYGFTSTGYWRDVGNLDEYIYSNLDTPKTHNDVAIENSIIGENVTIEKGASIKNSVIWDNVKIGSNVRILFDVIGKNCTIGENARINDFVFMGDNCEVGKNTFISSSIKIWDKKKIEDNTKVTQSLIYKDSFFHELFTDSRITGLSNLQINPEFGAKLGTVYGAYAGPDKTILLARDIDDISNMIKRSISSGMLSAGANVNDLQVIPIPILRQELKGGNGFSGIFVRKSPFDKGATDIIFFDGDGRDLSSSKTKSIERLYFSEEYQRADFYNVGKLRFPERTNVRYKQHFLSCLDVKAISKRKFRIVIDYSYGIISTIFPNILGDLKCETVSLSAHLEKERITRDDDEFKKAFDNFCYVVKSLNYDIGFMIDAGGEKIWVATKEGKILNGDRFLVLVLKLFLMVNQNVKKIAVPVQATREVDLVAGEYGVEVKRVKDTHYSMMMACDDEEVKFVGGTKGGFLFPDFLYATDGMFSIVKILELIAKSNSRFEELDEQLPTLFMEKENISCLKEEKGKIMRKFMEDTIEYKQELIDGVKIFINGNDTILCIPDKNRNLVHLNVETSSIEKSKKLMSEYKKRIESYLKR